MRGSLFVSCSKIRAKVTVKDYLKYYRVLINGSMDEL